MLHDPAAVLAAVLPNTFRYEDRFLSARIETGPERGRLIERADPAGRPVRYAVEVQGREGVRICLDRLRAWSGKVSGE